MVSRYHALVIHRRFPDPEPLIAYSTQHRTLKAAARSLSLALGTTDRRATPRPGPGWVTWCGLVCPDGRVLSLRQAQGKCKAIPLHLPIDLLLTSLAEQIEARARVHPCHLRPLDAPGSFGALKARGNTKHVRSGTVRG